MILGHFLTDYDLINYLDISRNVYFMDKLTSLHPPSRYKCNVYRTEYINITLARVAGGEAISNPT